MGRFVNIESEPIYGTKVRKIRWEVYLRKTGSRIDAYELKIPGMALSDLKPLGFQFQMYRYSLLVCNPDTDRMLSYPDPNGSDWSLVDRKKRVVGEMEGGYPDFEHNTRLTFSFRPDRRNPTQKEIEDCRKEAQTRRKR